MSRFHGKINFTRLTGIGCGVLFFTLLAFRLGLFDGDRPVALPGTESVLTAADTWHEIFQENDKIGYSHRRVIPQDEGHRVTETTFMRINTMGMVQDINVRTTGLMAGDLSLTEFTFQLKSSRFNFKAFGKVGRGEVQVSINGKPSVVAVKTPIYLASGIFEATTAIDMKIGETRTLNIFDPSSMSQRPIKVTFAGREILKILGRDTDTRRLETDFMGARHKAWVTGQGEIVKETGPLGITLKKSTASRAVADIAGHTRDLTQLVAVDAGRILTDTDKINQIIYNIKGIENLPPLSGDRQSLAGSRLTVTRESAYTQQGNGQPDPEGFLAPSVFVQADHPEILALADRLSEKGGTRLDRVLKIKKWLYTEIEKRPVLSVPNALETLKNRRGDCNEHAVLFAALARAAGVPARIEAGLVYLKGRFYYHAWNAVFLDQWVTVDALMNQFPADVSHIRLTLGGPESQIDLMGAIGRIELEILEIKHD